MAVKKIQKNARRKKIIKIMEESMIKDNNFKVQEVRHDEEAIRRQIGIIKKDYSRLLIDVKTGYGLVKHWVALQAETQGEILRSRFIKN